ncbi:MAG: VWA domain-containing protein [Candidatus Kuenenia sp.]|nr:VWA domain-containing protein [Candidatus Kuenenia hertensis]
MLQKNEQTPCPQQSRIPVILLVDTSESMREKSKFDALNEALINFKHDLETDAFADKSVDLSVVTFGSGINVVHTWSSIEKFDLPPIAINGTCLMGLGILKALALIEERKEYYKKNNMEWHKPVIVLIAGSEPIDLIPGSTMWRDTVEVIQESDNLGNLYFFTFVIIAMLRNLEGSIASGNVLTGIGTENGVIELLRKIAPVKRPPEYLKDNIRFNELVTRSIVSQWVCDENLKTCIENLPERVIEEQKEPIPIQSYHRIIGAAAIGPLHVVNGTPCQDAYSFEVFPSGLGIIAIADGLGSASKSEAGARIAVDAIVYGVKELVKKNLAEEIRLEIVAKESVVYARKVLGKKAAEYHCKLKELACTIIVVVMYKDNVVVAHIGDGAVVTKTNEGLRLISGPEESEYTNEVSPLTGKDWKRLLRVTPIISGILGVMAFSDGCQRAALRKTPNGLVPFEGFCEPIFSYIEEIKDIKEGEEDIKNLLLSKKICENSDDDKTLVIATLNECQKGNAV